MFSILLIIHLMELLNMCTTIPVVKLLLTVKIFLDVFFFVNNKLITIELF